MIVAIVFFLYLWLLHCCISQVDHSCQGGHLLGIKSGIVSGNYQASGGREWTSRFGLEGDRHLFLSPLSSRLRFDKAVVGRQPITGCPPKNSRPQLHHFSHSSFSPTIWEQLGLQGFPLLGKRCAFFKLNYDKEQMPAEAI